MTGEKDIMNKIIIELKKWNSLFYNLRVIFNFIELLKIIFQK